MSNIQTNSDDERIDRIAAVMKALSNPSRLRMFLRLATCCVPGTVCDLDAEGRMACVGDLGRDLGIGPSTVSHHLKELRNAGLIRVRREGQRIQCWVDPATVNELREFFKL